MLQKILKSIIAAGVILSANISLAQDHKTVLVKVGDDEITLGHVALFYESLSARYADVPLENIFPAIIDQLIRDSAIAQMGDVRGNPKFGKAIDNYARNKAATEVLNATIVKEEAQKRLVELYDLHIANVPELAEWNASHILVETREEAETLVKELNAGADFTTLAKENSKGPSGKNGGQLGWFSIGTMVPAFENAASSLELGEISDPVQTQFGWHVIRLNDQRIEARKTYKEALPELEILYKEELANTVAEQALEKFEVTRMDKKIDPELIADPTIFQVKK